MWGGPGGWDIMWRERGTNKYVNKEAILYVDSLALNAAAEAANESETNLLVSLALIPRSENSEQNEMVVLGHYILGSFTVQQQVKQNWIAML